MRKLLIIFSIFCINFSYAQDTLKVTTCGNALKDYYLKQDVLDKWLSGQHVNWETGEPDNPNATTEIKTHCSAFVAAICKRQEIYILRPPEHKQELLANAQFDWLNSQKGMDAGWHKISTNSLYESQRMANAGYLVIASVKNSNTHKPGHIAFVIPADRTIAELNQEGPLVIQAGLKNAVNISLKHGFKSHIVLWDTVTEDILFFYNDRKFNCR